MKVLCEICCPVTFALLASEIVLCYRFFLIQPWRFTDVRFLKLGADVGLVLFTCFACVYHVRIVKPVKNETHFCEI